MFFILIVFVHCLYLLLLCLAAKGSIVMEPQLPSEWQSGTESLMRLEESLQRTEEIIIDDERKMPPKFITQIQDLDNKVEGESAHFECRLKPVGDPTMKVEWFFNGKPLTTGWCLIEFKNYLSVL